MALITDIRPLETKWLFNNNNHIIEFYSDDTEKTAQFAEITIEGISQSIVIYPNLEGRFWFNFQQYFESLINDIEDNIDNSTINGSDVNSFVFDWSNIVVNPQIDYTITHTDTTTVTDQFRPWIINGVEDYILYKQGQNKDAQKLHILSPLNSNTANTHYLKYWEGYPFDIGLSQSVPNAIPTQEIKNLTTGDISPPISTPHKAQRLFISNGETDTNIESHLPLVVGKNNLRVQQAIEDYLYIDLYKIKSRCGVYIKWLNNFGGYNYWLFNQAHIEQLNSRARGVMFNDFAELADTQSPYRSIGRTFDKMYRLTADNLTKEDIIILSGLFESPCIYLFVGKPYSQNSHKSWLEVQLDSSSVQKRDFKGKIPDIEIGIKIPTSKTIRR